MKSDSITTDFVRGEPSASDSAATDAFQSCRSVPTVAITGSVGCGKSTLGRLLAASGAEVIDSDDIVHQLQKPGGTLSQAIGRTFGADCLLADGAVNRRKLASIVFADPQGLATLNEISHPLVRHQLANWRHQPATGWAKVALIPLLFEVGWEADWDYTVTVACEAQTQSARLQSRGWSNTEIERRMAAQWPTARKAALADFVINNDADLPTLERAAADLRLAILEKHLR